MCLEFVALVGFWFRVVVANLLRVSGVDCIALMFGRWVWFTIAVGVV